MNSQVQSILVRQMLFAGGMVAVLIAVVVALGWGLAKRSGPAAERVPAEVVQRCEAEIRSRMNNPGTVKFLMGGVSTKVRSEGGYLVRLTFKASNAYGMESEMRGLCSFPRGGGDPVVRFLD